MGVGRWAVVAAMSLLPLGSMAEVVPAKVVTAQGSVIVEGEEDGAESEDCGEAICGGDEARVDGAPLDHSGLGQVEPASSSADPGFDSGGREGWGIREHRLHPAPAGSTQGDARSGDLPMIPRPAWPGEQQVHDWDFAKAHSFPELTRSVDLELFSYVGGDGDDHPVFAERLRANLYVLEAGVTFFNSLAGRRDSQTDMDLDARLPFTLGRHHQLAVLPGVSFPIDSRRWLSSNTNVRLQAIYGFASEGFAFQLRGGFTQGERRTGLLKLRERVDLPASLYGALVAWRFVPAVQLRAEASGEISTNGGPDRISILPGVNFFPLGDPRVSVGATAIIETSDPRMSFDRASYGGLINVGVGFI